MQRPIFSTCSREAWPRSGRTPIPTRRQRTSRTATDPRGGDTKRELTRRWQPRVPHCRGRAPLLRLLRLRGGRAAKGLVRLDVGRGASTCSTRTAAASRARPGSEAGCLAAPTLRQTHATCSWPLASSALQRRAVSTAQRPAQPLWQAPTMGVEMVFPAMTTITSDLPRRTPRGRWTATRYSSVRGRYRRCVASAPSARHFPTSEVRQAISLRRPKGGSGQNAYEWEFIPIAGQTFTDRGSGSCH